MPSRNRPSSASLKARVAWIRRPAQVIQEMEREAAKWKAEAIRLREALLRARGRSSSICSQTGYWLQIGYKNAKSQLG
jgi:hypothetical protein